MRLKDQTAMMTIKSEGNGSQSLRTKSSSAQNMISAKMKIYSDHVDGQKKLENIFAK